MCRFYHKLTAAPQSNWPSGCICPAVFFRTPPPCYPDGQLPVLMSGGPGDHRIVLDIGVRTRTTDGDLPHYIVQEFFRMQYACKRGKYGCSTVSRYAATYLLYHHLLSAAGDSRRLRTTRTQVSSEVKQCGAMCSSFHLQVCRCRMSHVRYAALSSGRIIDAGQKNPITPNRVG